MNWNVSREWYKNHSKKGKQKLFKKSRQFKTGRETNKKET